MVSATTKLCDVCRNINFDEMLVAPDVEEREEEYYRWKRLPTPDEAWPKEEVRDDSKRPLWDADEKRGYQLYPSFTEVLKSGQNGCELCNAISLEVPRYLKEAESSHRQPFGDRAFGREVDWQSLPVQLSFWTSIEQPGAEVWVSLLWKRYDGAATTYVLAGAFSVWLEPDDPWHSLVLCCGRPIPTDPSSSASMQCAKRWLAECHKDHHLCAYGQDNIMPKRVIDVGPGNGTEEPRLIETDGQGGSWCTLSHTWGGKVTLTTTLATLTDRMNCISISELPLTFRDAVTIARRLDIRYVWIDSLCIIQDSESDWVEEARRMGEIYQNSILTISATTASNSEDGILGLRRNRFPPIAIRFQSQRFSFSGLLWIRHVLSPFDHSIEGKESPLSKRGWCLQERVLPPRTLHFGVEQMFWECRTTQQPEGLPSEMQYFGDRGRASVGWEWEDNKLYLLPLEKVREVFPEAGELPEFKDGPTRPTGIKFQINTHGLVPDHMYLNWYGIIENFTSRNLTKESDKLIALSGLVSEIHKLLDDDVYVAGLWRNDLLNELCWSPHYAEECFTPSIYRAPSWSWASLDGRVGYPHHHFKRSGTPAMPMGHPYDEAEIVEISVDSEDPFGSVTGGYLKIKTFFISVKINAKTFFNKPPPTGMLEQGDTTKVAPTQSHTAQGVEQNDHRGVRWIHNRHFQLVIFSEPHPFYNEEPIVPWAMEDNGTVVFAEDKFALNPRGKLECTLDQVYDVSQLGDGITWLEFLLARITGRYFLMIQPTGDEEGIYKRIGRAVMGKYTVFPEEIQRRLGIFTIM